MSAAFEVTVDAPHRRCIVGGEPLIFHCHHYNLALQQALLDAAYGDFEVALVGAGESVAFAQLSALFAEGAVADTAARAALAEQLYQWAGVGLVRLADLGPDGGRTATASSHYAQGCIAKFGKAHAPVCFFASGFIAGALAAIHGQPQGTYTVAHPTCMACSAPECVFEVTRASGGHAVYESPGVGTLSDHQPRPVPSTPVDYEGILGAVSGLPLVGDAQGDIDAFGVHLTRHYANYYNRVSFEFLHALSREYGEEGRAAACDILVEAGRVCAFNTFGGIMESTEWNALIRPTLASPEDWVHGMVAVVNAFGWGRWQVVSVSESVAEFVLHDDYESVGYRAMYGVAPHPVSFLAQGGVEGLMTLVYLAGIADAPALDEAFYTKVFMGEAQYRATPTASLAAGDAVTSFRVERVG
ncbi:MAG: hypothetical protein H6726_03805 [Sandaracinaceae bacterium]|nr:hypothetical protein [Sandaracinaceae bacterium]